MGISRASELISDSVTDFILDNKLRVVSMRISHLSPFALSQLPFLYIPFEIYAACWSSQIPISIYYIIGKSLSANFNGLYI